MRNSFASYQPCTATDKWVPKADQALQRQRTPMEEERLRERALLLQKKIPART